jgi:hypothetical protein
MWAEGIRLGDPAPALADDDDDLALIVELRAIPAGGSAVRYGR